MEIQRVKLDFRALKILMYIDVSTHTHTHMHKALGLQIKLISNDVYPIQKV